MTAAILRPLGLAIAVSALVLPVALSAQEKSDSADKPSAKGRLPNYWGKLELTDEQREKVYKAQAAVQQKKEPIEKEIKKLREQAKKKESDLKRLDQDLEAQLLTYLTSEQKDRLVELKAEAKKKAEARKKSSRAKRASATTEEPPETKPKAVKARKKADSPN